MRDRNREFRRVPLSDLMANPANWRRHPSDQRRAIRAVLEEIGFVGALLAFEGPNGLTLIDGHLRQEEIEGLDADFLVPVAVTDLTPEEANKVLATYDPLGAMATADKDALASLLTSMRGQDDGLDDLLESIARQNRVTLPIPESQTDPDETPDMVEEPYVQRGDLWLLGGHRLLCGDSTAAENVERLMEGERIDVLFTDPPYGIDYSGGRTQVVRLKPYGRMQGDAEADNGHFVRAALAVGAKDTWVCVSPINLAPTLAEHGDGVDAVIVWNKGRVGLGYQWVRRQCEFVIFRTQRPKTKMESSEFDLWDIPPVMGQDMEHGAQKPIELVERALRFSGGHIVFDPFVGSGTTIIAAERQGRRCYAMEISEQYVQVAIERWQNYTGKQAELIERR